MGVISNGTTLLDAGAIDSGVATGAMTLIKTLTASSSTNLSFVDGASSVVLDNTYKEYVFKYINIHPANDDVNFSVNFRDGGSAYDATKTSTYFRSNHHEDNSAVSLAYDGSLDLAQVTGVQGLTENSGNDADQSTSGYIHLFDPSNTTFVKHYRSENNTTLGGNISVNNFVAGYCNVTAAIDGVQFSFSAGAIASGTIKMYGIK